MTKYNVTITTEHCEHDYTMDFESAFHAWEFAEAIAPEGSEISVREAPKTVYVPLYGEQEAVEVQDLKAGMVTVWTGGATAEVAGIKSSKSGKTHQIVYADGSIDHRKMRTGRLVAIA